MSVQLRPACAADATAVADILFDFLDNTDWMPDLHEAEETHQYCKVMIARDWVTVAEDRGVIAGFLARQGQFIHALYVANGSCGHHIGHQLLRDAQMKEMALELWTFQANTGAQRFYLREGFREIERTDGARNDENLPDIRYRWDRKRPTQSTSAEVRPEDARLDQPMSKLICADQPQTEQPKRGTL